MRNQKLKESDFRRLRKILERDPLLKEIVDSAIAESTHRTRRRVGYPGVFPPLGIDDCWLRDRDVRIWYTQTDRA